MRICSWGISEAKLFERTRKKPDCRLHDHKLPANAEALVASGLFQWVGEKRRAISPTSRATEAGYDHEVGPHGKPLVWVACGTNWQMKDCFGSTARHFERTRYLRDPMNFSPNNTTKPRFHLEQSTQAHDGNEVRGNVRS